MAPPESLTCTLFSNIKQSKFQFSHTLTLSIVTHTRMACSIQMENFVVITGIAIEKDPEESLHDKVMVYNNDGFVEEWPKLKRGRLDHACGHFVNSDNKVVRQYLSPYLV